MIAAQGQTIADAFALGQVRAFRHAADGMMAQVWRLDTASGSYAVKEFDSVPDRYQLHVQLEVSAQLADAAARAGIYCPRNVRSTTGDLLHRLDDSGRCAAYIGVATWIDGRQCEVRRDRGTAARWLGVTVAAIELIPDPPQAPALDPWLERFLTAAPTEAQWRTVLDHAQQAERSWARLLESRIAQLVSLGSIVGRPSEGPLCLLHTDLQPKNVLVTPTGFALLDWDDAALCSRNRMLGRILVEWLTPGGVDAAAIMRFMRAYRTRGGRGAINDLGDFGYAAAAFLNYAYETVTFGLTDHGARLESTKQVSAVLAEPMGIPTLDRVLEIVRRCARVSGAGG